MITTPKRAAPSEVGELEILSKPLKDTLGRNRPEGGADMATFKDWVASGLTGAEFARRHGINYATFCSRIRRARLAAKAGVTRTPGNIPESVTSVPNVSGKGAFVRVDMPVRAHASAAPVLVLSGDIRIEGADVPTLVSLIRALKGAL